MTGRDMTDFADDRIWYHFPDTVAATITADTAGLARAAGLLHDTYHGDPNQMDDALFRIGAALAEDDELCAAITDGTPDGRIDGAAWLSAHIRRCTDPRYLPTTTTR